MSEEHTGWRRCSSCKQWIGFESRYYVCSVSTCTRKRTGFIFCSVPCWEIHLPMMRHREAWAVEETSPGRVEWEREKAEEASAAASPASAKEPSRRVVAPAATAAPSPGQAPREVLLVVSRLKNYVRAVSGMNTSDTVLDPLSDHIRAVCQQAIENARLDGRKTVLDRDFAFLRRR